MLLGFIATEFTTTQQTYYEEYIGSKRTGSRYWTTNLIKQFWRILQAMMWLSRNRIKHDTEQTEGTTPANTILLRGAITREYAYTGVRHFTSNFIQQLHNHSGYFTRHRPLHYHLSKTMVYPHQTRKGAGSRVVTLTSFLMNSRPHLVYARMGRTTSTQHSLDGYGFFFF